MNFIMFNEDGKKMKTEWRKSEKKFYIPKSIPEFIEVPEFKFFMIAGKGNPNDSFFEQYLKVLFSLSYSLKMSYKAGFAPDNYKEYTVYPLEAVWDISQAAKENFNGKIDKNSLVFNLMIRQPDFASEDFIGEVISRVKKKNPELTLINDVRFESIMEGKCVQMLHLGTYDEERKSFNIMEEFTQKLNLTRKTKLHREIYLSDPRKVSPDKLKTTLRFEVE
jgi:hypothetical protein